MTDHMHPIFSQIMRRTQFACGMNPTDYPPPRTPEEVRLILGAETAARQTQDKQPAPAEFSADAI